MVHSHTIHMASHELHNTQQRRKHKHIMHDTVRTKRHSRFDRLGVL